MTLLVFTISAANNGMLVLPFMGLTGILCKQEQLFGFHSRISVSRLLMQSQPGVLPDLKHVCQCAGVEFRSMHMSHHHIHSTTTVTGVGSRLETGGMHASWLNTVPGMSTLIWGCKHGPVIC
jgi:hypothetical protein